MNRSVPSVLARYRRKRFLYRLRQGDSPRNALLLSFSCLTLAWTVLPGIVLLGLVPAVFAAAARGAFSPSLAAWLALTLGDIGITKGSVIDENTPAPPAVPFREVFLPET